MAEIVQQGLVRAVEAARQTTTQRATNGVVYGTYGDTDLVEKDLSRMIGAVPATIAGALSGKAYYFVPLALPEASPAEQTEEHKGPPEETMIAAAYTAELGDEAVCHRNVSLGSTEGVFISTRVLNDRFALAFEFFINVGHAFAGATVVPERFAVLATSQAMTDVRGETSQDAQESRAEAFPPSKGDGRRLVNEKAKGEFLEAAFADSVAIYLLSLTVDFDYSELREREYPLLAPSALAERLRLMAELYPPNRDYEFSIRYRRRWDR